MGENEKRNMAARVVLTIAVIILLVISLAPVVWLFISSFKFTGELFVNRWGLPHRIAWENYQNAWVRGRIGDYFTNSIIVSVGSVVIMVLVGSLAAFAISKYERIKAGFHVLLYFLLGQMIPAQTVIVPLYIQLNKIGLLNTYSGLILTYTASGLPFVVLVMQGFFRKIPKELYEAASIDGYAETTVFLKIAMPLAKPALATIIIVQFLFVWNEFVLATVLNNDSEKMTLPVGIYRAVFDQYSTDYGVAFAGICITLIPMVLIYSLFQKYILGGMTAGAMKG